MNFVKSSLIINIAALDIFRLDIESKQEALRKLIPLHVYFEEREEV